MVNVQSAKCGQKMIEAYIQWHPIPSLNVEGQYDDVECTLATCFIHDASKHEWLHHDAVNRIEIRLKIRGHAIRASSFVIEHTIEGGVVLSVM